MAGILPRFGQGPITQEVVETVKGGQLVEARAGGKVGVAAAGSLVVLGVATRDAVPTASANGTDALGNPTLTLDGPSKYVAVGSNAHYPVKYTAAATFGVALIAAANGEVTPAGAAPDARTIIGYCAEPLGVAAGATGLVKITR